MPGPTYGRRAGRDRLPLFHFAPPALQGYPAPDLVLPRPIFAQRSNSKAMFSKWRTNGNWTDASFKTYSTPLSRPFPVEVASGEEIHQKVTLNLSGGRKMVPTEEEPERGSRYLAILRGKAISQAGPLRRQITVCRFPPMSEIAWGVFV